MEVKGKTKFLEVCESCLNFMGVVERPYSVKIEYYTKENQKKEETLEGFIATAFCHEYAHLEGILHIDKAKRVSEMTLAERKDYHEKHPYEVISKN